MSTHIEAKKGEIANKLLVFKGNGEIEETFSSLSDYLAENSQSSGENKTSAPKKMDESAPVKVSKNKKTLSYMEKKEWETIEVDIQELESQLETVQEEIENSLTDHVKLNELTEVQTELNKKLQEKYERWEYLAEYS